MLLKIDVVLENLDGAKTGLVLNHRLLQPTAHLSGFFNIIMKFSKQINTVTLYMHIASGARYIHMRDQHKIIKSGRKEWKEQEQFC